MTRSIEKPTGPSNGAEPVTKATLVYERLVKEIVDGDLKPGHQLAAHRLSDKYEVSVSAIREALNRLTHEGLVVLHDHRGFRVAHASLDDLLEIVHARCRLEEVALRESIRRGDARWEERVVLAHHRLSRWSPTVESVPSGEQAQWETTHREFHLALISACNSRFLVQYCGGLQRRLARYRNLTVWKGRRGEHAAEEHQALRDAALERDAETATKMVTKHFQATGELIASCKGLDSD